MKKILKVIGIILLVIIAFVLIAGIFVPKTYHIDRSITVNASRDKIWSHVSSLQSIDKWNPWLEADPNVQVSYEGQPGTVGSVYKWKGNKNVGTGSQTLTKLQQPERVESHLHFIAPFEGEADAYIDLTDAAGGTKVTWGFDTKYKYPMNVMQLFLDMDDMMGKQYDKGLNKLKALSEAN